VSRQSNFKISFFCKKFGKKQQQKYFWIPFFINLFSLFKFCQKIWIFITTLTYFSDKFLFSLWSVCLGFLKTKKHNRKKGSGSKSLTNITEWLKLNFRNPCTLYRLYADMRMFNTLAGDPLLIGTYSIPRNLLQRYGTV